MKAFETEAELARAITAQLAQYERRPHAGEGRKGRLGVLAGVSSLEAGWLPGEPFSKVFDDTASAVACWEAERRRVLTAFGAEIWKIQLGIESGDLEPGDCIQAVALLVEEPPDPEGELGDTQGFAVLWDFSLSPSIALRSFAIEDTWEEVFGKATRRNHC